MLEFRRVLPGDDEAISLAREMFLEYQKELGVDLCFQAFEAELAGLPGAYGPPLGALYLVSREGRLAACGGVRSLGKGICELKRLYVRPDFRRQGIARQISERLMDDGRAAGHTVCRLDTLARLAPALEMYRALGFEEIPAYNYNPEPDIVYLERRL